MEILDFRVYRGPNLYSYWPVIRMDVDLGDYYQVTSDEIADFNRQLINLLPGLKDHSCSRGYQGGFIERLQEGTYLGHVIEHVCLELQNLVDINVNYGSTRRAECEGKYHIIYSFEEEKPAVLAGRHALSIVDRVADQKPPDLDRRIRELKDALIETGLGPSTKALVAAARKRGIPTSRLEERSSLIRLGYGARQKRIQASITDNTSCVAVDSACDKWRTRKLLSKQGLPVPRGELVEKPEECMEFAEEIGVPVVTKPADQNQGKGVTLNLRGEDELGEAFHVARKYGSQVLVEENIPGDDYRLLVVDGEMVAASRKRPAQVTGDGEHSIRELIERENRDPRRGEGHEKPLTKIQVDEVVQLMLDRQELSLDTVPESGRDVLLRENGNLSTGGTAIDVTDEVHPYNRHLAEEAARTIGLDVAGIDLVARDISSPIDGKNGAIIEVNAAPGLRMHHHPTEGKPRDVAGAIIESLFDEKQGRIPIVSVTGTNGKTTTVRLLGDMLRRKGYTVGMTTTDGIFIDGECRKRGDMTGPVSARTVLGNRRVEAAVLETARGGILRGGLGYDYADVGIVTNISADHLQQHGVNNLKDLAYVKSLVVETVGSRGFGVLNADDPYTVKMKESVPGQVIYFSLNGSQNEVITEHLQSGGRAVYLEDGMIVMAEGSGFRKELVSVDTVPLTVDGLAEHNTENCLAATAGAWALQISPENICSALENFRVNPGRLEIFEAGPFTAIIDYGHNPAGYQAVLQVAKGLTPANLIGVIGVPGDRPDSLIREVGQIAGEGFDHLIIKEDEYLRGREPGEVSELLKAGIIECSQVSCDDLEFILDEKEAVRQGAMRAQKGDVLVVFFEKEPSRLKEIILEEARERENLVAPTVSGGK